MTTKYECDITGKQYTKEDKVRTVNLGDDNGVWDRFEFGPEATIDEVRDKLHEMIDEFQPFHQDWYVVQTDQYNPPRIERRTIAAESAKIVVPTVINLE